MATDRVLLVDDEKDFVETLAERMRARGLEVDTAYDGHQALERVSGARYDAIVLDLAMPGMDGIETLKQLREHDPDAQIILLTGQGTVRSAVEATQLGALDFLEKPTDIETLTERIRDARANRMALREERSRDEIEAILEHRGW
jgi:DNA-binding NtrC family response regulator